VPNFGARTEKLRDLQGGPYFCHPDVFERRSRISPNLAFELHSAYRISALWLKTGDGKD
jgi:hypothetical protein